MSTPEDEIDFDAEEAKEQRTKTVDNDDTIPKVVQFALDAFRLVSGGAEAEQRELEEDDLEFDAGKQWPDEVIASRAKQVINGVTIPPRPMLTISKLGQPISLVMSAIRGAHLGVTVHPESEEANQETAEVFQGIIRHIEVTSNAQAARNWACDRAVRAGRGYYRILKRYVDEGAATDAWGDQELVIKRILNGAGVYLDPYAVEPDWSDADWGMVGGFVRESRYKQRWPKSKLTAMMEGEGFEGIGDEAPGWMSDDIAGQRGYRVMELFKVERTQRKRLLLDAKMPTLAGEQLDDVHLDEFLEQDDPESSAKWLKDNQKRIRQQRTVEQRKVMWYTLNGIEVLDEEEWDGIYIPILPVIGREKFYRNTRRWEGVVRPAKDGQRLYNYSATSAVEMQAMDTKAPYIGVEGQFEGHEEEWSQANTRNFPYLQVRPVSFGGQQAPMPQRNVAGPNLQGPLALLQAADEFIKSTTATYAPSLGDTSGAKSGRAIMALKDQSEGANSEFLDNLKSVTMPFEAKQLLDLIPKIYDRPGRVQRILGIDDQPREVILNAPFVPGPGGRPQPVPNVPGVPPAAPQGMMPPQGMPGMPPQMPPQPGTLPGVSRGPAPQPKHFDLSKGRYSLAVTIGKSYASRLSQGVDEMSQVLSAAPDLLKIIGDIYFRFRDFPGHTEIAERMKKMLPPQLQEGQEGQDNPEALKAQLAQAQQAMQQLQGEFQQAMDAIKTKQVEAQGKVQSETVKAQAQLELERMRIEGDQMLAEIKAKLDLSLAQMKLDSETRKQDAQIAADDLGREDEQKHEFALETLKAELASQQAEAAHERMESMPEEAAEGAEDDEA